MSFDADVQAKRKTAVEDEEDDSDASSSGLGEESEEEDDEDVGEGGARLPRERERREAVDEGCGISSGWPSVVKTNAESSRRKGESCGSVWSRASTGEPTRGGREGRGWRTTKGRTSAKVRYKYLSVSPVTKLGILSSSSPVRRSLTAANPHSTLARALISCSARSAIDRYQSSPVAWYRYMLRARRGVSSRRGRGRREEGRGRTCSR